MRTSRVSDLGVLIERERAQRTVGEFSAADVVADDRHEGVESLYHLAHLQEHSATSLASEEPRPGGSDLSTDSRYGVTGQPLLRSTTGVIDTLEVMRSNAGATGGCVGPVGIEPTTKGL